ncbi:MAG: hypothetical protein P1P69_04640 [Methanosarcinaceae archaeon]|nr:hypothetical protein [Methanosarcinaceae archaeon]
MSGIGKKNKSIPDKCKSCMICHLKPKKDDEPDNDSSSNDDVNS